MNMRTKFFKHYTQILCQYLQSHSDASPEAVWLLLNTQHRQSYRKREQARFWGNSIEIVAPSKVEENLVAQATDYLGRKIQNAETRADYIGLLQVFFGYFPELLNKLKENTRNLIQCTPYMTLNTTETGNSIERYLQMIQQPGYNQMEVRVNAARSLCDLISIIPSEKRIEVRDILERGVADKYCQVRHTCSEALLFLTESMSIREKEEQIHRLMQRIKENHNDEDNMAGTIVALGWLGENLSTEALADLINQFPKIMESGFCVMPEAIRTLGKLSKRIPETFQPEVIQQLFNSFNQFDNSFAAEATHTALKEITLIFNHRNIQDASERYIHLFFHSEDFHERLLATKIVGHVGHILFVHDKQKIIEKLILQLKEKTIDVKTKHGVYNRASWIRAASAMAFNNLRSHIPVDSWANVINTLFYVLNEDTCDDTRTNVAKAILGMMEEASEKQIAIIIEQLISLNGTSRIYGVKTAIWQALCKVLDKMPNYSLPLLADNLRKNIWSILTCKQSNQLGKIISMMPEDLQLPLLTKLFSILTGKDNDRKNSLMHVFRHLDTRVSCTVITPFLKDLLRELNSNTWQTRDWSANALGALWAIIPLSILPEILKALKQLLQDEISRNGYGSNYVKIEILHALGELSSRLPEGEQLQLSYLLCKNLNDTDFEVCYRQAAIKALTTLINKTTHSIARKICRSLVSQILTMNISHQNIEGISSLIILCMKNLTEKESRYILYAGFTQKLFQLEQNKEVEQSKWLRQVLFLVSAHCHTTFKTRQLSLECPLPKCTEEAATLTVHGSLLDPTV